MAVLEGVPQNGLQRGAAIATKIMPDSFFKSTEERSVTSAFGVEGQYLGLVKLWNQYRQLSTTLISMTELENKVIYTDKLGIQLTYDTPFKLSLPRIVEDILGTNQTPGRGREEFSIVLSTNGFTQHDILTYDRFHGVEVYVTSTEVTPYGSGYLYTVKGTSEDPESFVPRRFLQADTEWFKITNFKTERSTQNSSITNHGKDGIARLMFQTSSSLQSVSHWITGHADMIDIQSTMGGMDVKGCKNLNEVAFMYNYMTDGDPYDPSNPDARKGSNVVKGSMVWMPMILKKIYEEQAKMQEMSLMWEKGGVAEDGRGGQARLGMGLYPQMRLGNLVEYTKTSQLLNILKNAVGDLFQNRSYIPLDDRRVTFEMGMGAMNEIQKAFQAEFKQDNPFIVMADHPSLKGLLTGDNKSLRYNGFKMISYTFPECGTVEIKHNPALDFEGTRSESSRFGKYPNQSYSVLVKDVTDESFSNARLSKGGYTEAQGFGNGANILMIKPRNYDKTYTSFRVGTYCPDVLKQYVGASANSHIASDDRHGFGTTIHWAGEILLLDPSRTILIERIDPLRY